MKPLLALDVDGVLAIEHPMVPVEEHSISAYGKWRRTILVPVGAREVLHELNRDFECIWVSAWAHAAHPALLSVLDLPARPWPWIGRQFHKLPAITAAAAGRPWAWIDDGIDDLGVLADPAGGVLVRVDPRRGIVDVDPAALLETVLALGSAHGSAPAFLAGPRVAPGVAL